MKKCPSCKNVKPLDAFGLCMERGKQRRQSWCIACRSASINRLHTISRTYLTEMYKKAYPLDIALRSRVFMLNKLEKRRQRIKGQKVDNDA